MAAVNHASAPVNSKDQRHSFNGSNLNNSHPLSLLDAFDGSIPEGKLEP